VKTNYALAAVGAVMGGAIGYFLFVWLVRHGFYALALPGALLGLGGGWLVKCRSIPVAAVCGILALALGIFSRWRVDAHDQHFTTFLSHLGQMSPVTLLMIGLGGVFGFWFALGRKQSTS